MAHTQTSSSSSTRRSLRLLTAERKSTATTTNESNVDEEEEPVPRQAKSKALEALAISSSTTNRRRTEFDLEGVDDDNNEEEQPSTSRKRTHSKRGSSPHVSSSSSHHSIRHVPHTVRRRKRSKKTTPSTTISETLSTNTKTLKRQRTSSSEEDNTSPFPSSSSTIKKNSKRNSAPAASRTRSRTVRRKSESNSDTEQPREGADTGNLCVRRGPGGRELHSVVSDPSASSSTRRSRTNLHRYSSKVPVDYLTTGQSSSSRSSVPASGAAVDGRPCDTNSSTNPSATTSQAPVHLFNSPAYYQQTTSPSPSSSAQSYSGVVPAVPHASLLVASAASASSSSSTSHRHHHHHTQNNKQTLQMSTESDTDPDNNGGSMSPPYTGNDHPSPRDVLADPAFARAAAAAAAGGPTSAALFHTLSGRVQHLMSRVGGGGSSANAINGRLQQHIQGIQSPDPDVRLSTLNELCSLLVMSNEETLPGFQFRALYPPLRDCMADENEANAEIALTACRALTYLMEALPRSAVQVVEATPVFLSKLRSITSIDIAEQALTALEMISKRNGKQILIADGIGACLEYIDFFSMTSQNKALAIVANCSMHILTRNDFAYIRTHLENLSNRLRSDDKKSIENVCNIFARLVENFHRDATILCEIASTPLLKMMQTMLVVQPTLLNGVTFVSIVHMLYLFCAYCPTLAVTLLKMNIAETLMCLLTGSAEVKITKRSITTSATPFTYKSAALATNETTTTTTANLSPMQQNTGIELIARTPQELYEIVSLIGEMMPRLPVDDPLFQVDQLFRRSLLSYRSYDAASHGYILWHWQDDQGQLRPYSLQDSRSIEHAWQQHEEEIQLIIAGRPYLIDLQQLQQINEETNQARFIKRIVTPSSPDTTEPSATPPATTTTDSTDVTTTANNRSTTNSLVVDARMEMMKDNIELYSAFIQSLFTVLYEVYNSSAGPAVKHRCLQALLRMIYYSPNDLLEIILKQQSISSHIASMLASSDYKIVVSALQMAEILMKKLPQIFSIYFYREGVVHQIEILVGFGVTSSASHPLTLSHSSGATGSRSQLDLPHLAENPSTTSLPQLDPGLSASFPPSPAVPIPQPPANTGPGLSESFDDQQMHYASGPPPPHRGAATQLHPKAQSFPYRGTTTRRHYTTEPIPSTTSEAAVPPATSTRGSLATRVETRSQRARGPASGSSRMKASTRSMLDEMTSGTAASSRPTAGRGGSSTASFSTGTLDMANASMGLGRSRPTRGGPPAPTLFRPTAPTSTFDPSAYYPLSTAGRSRPSTPVYVPAPYLHPPNPHQPYPYATSAPTAAAASAAASLMMSASMHSHYAQAAAAAQQQQVNAAATTTTLSSQDKATLKEWIQTQARNFRSTYFSTSSSSSNAALGTITRLASAVDILHVGKDESENTKSLRDIAGIIAKGDVSPFEMVHSGLITKLFQYLTDDLSVKNDRPERLKQLLHIFVDMPLINDDDDDDDDEENEQQQQQDETTLRAFIVDLHHTQINSDLRSKLFHRNILAHLITKLHGCINQLEQFPIRVNDIAGRPAHSSALRLMTTHQLKCNLIRHSQCKTLKQWNSGPVKIDPLALVSAIEKYLLLRGIANGGALDDPSGTVDDEESEVSNESDAEDVINVLTRSATLRLEFLINDRVIPHNMTIYQAVRLYSTPTPRAPDGESETDTDEGMLPSAAIWTRVHTITYRQASGSPSTTTTNPLTTTATAVPAVSTAIGGAAATTSSGRMRRSGSGAQTPSSKFAKKPTKTSKRPSLTSTIDELWINGQCPKSKSLLVAALNESISSILTINDLSLNAIFLLRILNGLNIYWYDLYSETNAMPIMNNNHNLHSSTYLTLVPKQEFISAKLTAKVNRQLQDPVVIMMGQVPSWITEMGYSCSFLFPFETRQMLFYAYAFDRERAMQRLLDNSDMLSQQHTNDQTDRQAVAPRIERKKVQLSRSNILAEMEKILDSWNSKHFLEVQYEDEVGFGLGPTLEAYSMISKELQKNGLELWRTDRIFDSTRDKDTNMSEHVDSRNGLYPAPLGRNAKASGITKSRQKFKFLGKFMAKALMDSRMIDMPFSVIFYKWMLGQEETLNIEDLLHVDTNLYEQLKKLQSIVHKRDKIFVQHQSSTTHYAAATATNKSSTKKRLKSKDDPTPMESSPTSTMFDDNDERLLLDGCKIEDLSLVFTLPGHPNIELKKAGKDCLVTIHNLDQYVNLVVYWTLVEGVRRQFESFRDGFNSIFSVDHLKCFYPDELHQIFCGSGSTDLWDLKTLLESTRCDHGYNLNSRAVKWLFEIMTNFDIDEQRAFLQFVTGSPRLPVGGFRMLHPPLTVVRKTAENNTDNNTPDSFLPSVMTCVNYLKLPDYSTKEIMKAKLTTAIRDGQFAFLLS